MRRKMFFSLALSLVLVFAMASVALAAYCMDCGTQLPDAANFCFNCGAKQSSTGSSSTTTTSKSSDDDDDVSSTMKITKITDNGDGTVSMRWNDSGSNSPYCVYSLQKFSDDFEADLDAALGTFTCAEDLYSRTVVLDTLVPGVDYWLIVEDCNEDYTWEEYEASTLPRFYEFNTDISIQLKYRRNNAYEEVTSFSASDFNRNRSNTTYGAYIRLDYPQLARARQYRYMVAISDPTGEVVVDALGDMELDRGRSYTYWTYYSFDWYLSLLADEHGSLPVGTYTWSLYYDGMFVSSQTFRITN